VDLGWDLTLLGGRRERSITIQHSNRLGYRDSVLRGLDNPVGHSCDRYIPGTATARGLLVRLLVQWCMLDEPVWQAFQPDDV